MITSMSKDDINDDDDNKKNTQNIIITVEKCSTSTL